MDFLGGLIGAGAKLLGGIFSNNANNQINQQNIAAQNQINAVNVESARQLNERNIQEQEAFAQDSVTWRTRDMMRASAESGINPLAMLGVGGTSFSNVTGSADLRAPVAHASTALGDAMGDAGQSLGRSIAAYSSQTQRQQELENKLLEARIANVNSDTVKNAADSSSIATKLGAAGLPPPYDWNLGGPYDPRKDYPARFAKPLTETYVTNTGDLTELPTAAASTATQTLMAAPASAIGAVQLLRDNLDHFLRFTFGGVRGDATRNSDRMQYQQNSYIGQ